MAHAQTAAAFLLILLVWQLVGLKVPRYILPTPLATLTELYVRAPLLAQHALTTLGEIALGFLLGVLVSVPCGMAVAFSRSVERVVMPVLVFTQLVPKIALAPLFIIWFGFGLFPKVFMTFLLSFFPIVIDSIAGFRSLDREIEHLIRSMGLGVWPAFVKVRLPHALPQIFTGLKVAITLATVGAIIGEFVGSDRGLGYAIVTASSSMNTSLVFGIMALLALMGIAVFYVVWLVEALACPWYQPADRQEPPP
jgi:NitT/TauT family transport system permease protein